MNTAKYKYPAEKFAAARLILMAPHPKGEADSFGRAFIECGYGLDNLSIDDLNDYARSLVQTVKQTMDTTGIDDPNGRGT